MTPLLYARQFGHDDAAEWLIEHGAEEAGVVQPLEGAELEVIEVKLIQMQSIISHKALHISHIIFYTTAFIGGEQGKDSIDAIGV